VGRDFDHQGWWHVETIVARVRSDINPRRSEYEMRDESAI
jgi:hypothetical protein